MKPKQTLHGPSGLRIELDASEIFPDDPGAGTPAMVYRNKGLCDECSGTFGCVIETGEFINVAGDGDPFTTGDEASWLETKRQFVDDFITTHSKNHATQRH